MKSRGRRVERRKEECKANTTSTEDQIKQRDLAREIAGLKKLKR